MNDTWHCEECGDEQTGDPAATDTYPGVGGRVTLWFCDDCTRGLR